MTHFAGIDIGSTAIKLALVDSDGRLVDSSVTDSGSLFQKNARLAYDRLLAGNGIDPEQVAYLVSTGYGRKLFKDADENVSEITANAAGAKGFAAGQGTVRTIINIGGQDSKAIGLDGHGNVANFVMNDRCAAGTGRFLEVVARTLEIGVDELGDYHFNAKGAPLAISSTCTVFAESEIISLLAAGHEKEDIVAGIHHSIAKRVAGLANRVGLEEQIFFDGGPALNQGLVAALEAAMGRKVLIPHAPQITTAYGAALLAQESYALESEESA